MKSSRKSSPGAPTKKSRLANATKTKSRSAKGAISAELKQPPREHIKLTVLISEQEDGWWLATCPVLPGCVSQGETQQEAVKNIEEAIIGWLTVKNERATKQARQARNDQGQLRELALSF
jgi:predicted RNase H-like HicB family nuclease